MGITCSRTESHSVSAAGAAVSLLLDAWRWRRSSSCRTAAAPAVVAAATAAARTASLEPRLPLPFCGTFLAGSITAYDFVPARRRREPELLDCPLLDCPLLDCPLLDVRVGPRS